VKIFLVFTVESPEEWVDVMPQTAERLAAPPAGTSYVVIDNDSSPDLGHLIFAIAEKLGAKVQRTQRTPKWKIISDVLTGQALSGCTEPTLIASAADPRLVQPIEVRGLVGPPGEISEDFVYTTNPVEMMESVAAKTRDWPGGNPFAPATVVTRHGVRHAAPLENVATMFGVDVAAVAEAKDEGPMPQPVHQSLVDYYRERLGPQATDFIVKLQSASQIADDFVDGEIRASWAPDAMRQLLEFLLLEVPNDQFYREHRMVLEEAVAQCLSVWHMSNELAVDPTPESRLWCFIQREAFQIVIWRTAVIVGGLAHGRLVLKEIQQLLHGPNGVGKKFPDWLAETRAKSSGR
jgi:hypothetical protein